MDRFFLTILHSRNADSVLWTDMKLLPCCSFHNCLQFSHRHWNKWAGTNIPEVQKFIVLYVCSRNDLVYAQAHFSHVCRVGLYHPSIILFKSLALTETMNSNVFIGYKQKQLVFFLFFVFLFLFLNCCKETWSF